MHERKDIHDAFLRQTLQALGVEDAIYISENTYDGGYEVRVGPCDFFIDYETAEEEDAEYVKGRLELCS